MGNKVNINDNKKESVSQNKRILAFLLEGHSITPLAALIMFDTLRLSARISDLRGEGWDIKTERVKDKKSNKWYASYKLIQGE